MMVDTKMSTIIFYAIQKNRYESYKENHLFRTDLNRQFKIFFFCVCKVLTTLISGASPLFSYFNCCRQGVDFFKNFRVKLKFSVIGH